MNIASDHLPPPFALRHIYRPGVVEEPVAKVVLVDPTVDRNLLYVARLASPRCCGWRWLSRHLSLHRLERRG
jgi:hypothetical protein